MRKHSRVAPPPGNENVYDVLRARQVRTRIVNSTCIVGGLVRSPGGLALSYCTHEARATPGCVTRHLRTHPRTRMSVSVAHAAYAAAQTPPRWTPVYRSIKMCPSCRGDTNGASRTTPYHPLHTHVHTTNLHIPPHVHTHVKGWAPWDDDVFYFFLQKQKIGSKFLIYL